LAQHVDDGYLLGNRIGVTGTPALYSSDGGKFNGYVPYQQLIPQLIKQ
jgi:protein-disulfide isomerase